MAKQRTSSLILAITVLILAANFRFSAASFPTSLAHKSRSIWPTLGPEPARMPPSPSPQPAPSPSPHPLDVIKGGYWPSGLAYSLPPSSIPTLYFTHVFYAFVGVDASSHGLSITPLDDQWMENFTSTLHAKNPPAQALLSIGGANSSTNISNLVSSLDNRAAFIKSTIATARKYGFDGLDLDWEVPSNSTDMSNLALFFQEWRQAVEREALDSGKPPLLLSAAVYFASSFFVDLPRTYPADAIAKFLDFVNPMCYNYRGSWDTSVSGEHALLYDKTSNISTSSGISSWIGAGVPPEKLVMGMPLYGKTWKLKDPKNHEIGAPAVAVGPGDEGILPYNEIVTYNDEHHAGVVYDGDTVSEYSYSGTDWIGYDGPTSVANKVQYAKTNNLGGYFFWALGYDFNWTLSAIASNVWDQTH